jgi:hypothetical protein
MIRSRLMLTIVGLVCLFSTWLGVTRSLAQSPSVPPKQIFYVSCLLNGVGPGIDIRPFAIIHAITKEKSEVPVGTQVIRLVDETGELAPPDDKGRVMILWNEAQWWITEAALKQYGPNGETDCDGSITPVPTPTQVAIPATSVPPTSTPIPPTETPVVVSGAPVVISNIEVVQGLQPVRDPNLPVYNTGRFTLPDIHGVFGNQPVGVIGSYRIYDNSTLDVIPRAFERCVDSTPSTVLSKCDPEAVNVFIGTEGIPVYAPVTGCLIQAANDKSTTILIPGCESNARIQNSDGTQFTGRREIVISHLDPDSVKRLGNYKAGDQVGNLCVNTTKADCNVNGDLLPYLSVQLRIRDAQGVNPASKEELLAFLGTPFCIYDDYLYSPTNPAANPDPLQGCA